MFVIEIELMKFRNFNFLSIMEPYFRMCITRNLSSLYTSFFHIEKRINRI